jgi:hypothetical protein
MSPPQGSGPTVPFDVAKLAVDVAELRGELQLHVGTVSERISVLTTATNNIQHEQMLAREDRLKQTALLVQLEERTRSVPGGNDRMQAIERQVSLWRGIVIGLGFAISLAVYVYQTDKAAINATVSANTAAIRALERAK